MFKNILLVCRSVYLASDPTGVKSLKLPGTLYIQDYADLSDKHGHVISMLPGKLYVQTLACGKRK
jgi:hypothetical protein